MRFRNLAFTVSAFVLGVALTWVLRPAPAEHASDPSHAHSDLYTCGMHPQVVQDGPGTCPICGMNLTPMQSNSGRPAPVDNAPCTEDRALYWRAPMDPSYVRSGPGKSPMGMALLPVCDEGSAGVVSVASEIVQSMGVVTAPVERGPLVRTIRTVARVVPNERREVVVTTKVSGWVEKLFVNETGQFVRRGQALFSIYSPDLVSGQQEYLLARQQGDSVLTRTAKDRLRFWDLTERQITALEARGQPEKAITIYSPATGYVAKKSLLEGGKVRPEAVLFRIVDLSKVWVQADVYEYELPWLKHGQPAQLSLSYVPGRVFEGQVTYIYPTVDERSRTVQVRLEFDNPGLLMRPGMFGSASIDTQNRQDVLQVPTSAILRTGRRNVAFIALGEGRYKGVEVTLGEEGEHGRVEVIEGLHAGSRVVTNGHFLLDSESQLQEAINMMRAGPGGPAGAQPASQPSTQPSSGPASQPASQPSSRPASQPAGR